MIQITIDKITEDSLSQHIEVGASEYFIPEVLDKDHLRWKHMENPSGYSVCINLRNSLGQIVGHEFLQPRMLSINGVKKLNAAVITDLVIAPKDRNAAALVGMTRAAKGTNLFDLVLHTSNNMSDMIYRGLFKFPIICSLTAGGLPLKVNNFFNKFIKNRLISNSINFMVAPWRLIVSGCAYSLSKISKISLGEKPHESCIDDILQCFSGRVGLHFERSQTYLRWRFHNGPISKSQLLWVYSSSDCLGYISVRKVSINGLDILVIMDSVLKRPVGIMESIAIKMLTARAAVLENCDAVLCLANMANDDLSWWRKFPFIPISDKFLPHPTPIFIHTMNVSIDDDLKRTFFITLADLDYF